MQSRYEENGVIVTETVVQLATQFPVCIVYKYENPRPYCRTLHEHVLALAQHGITYPDEQPANGPLRV